MHVTYLGCVLDEVVSGKPIALKAIKNKWEIKISLYEKRYLTRKPQWLLFDALIQQYLDYARPAWYPNPKWKTKNKIQIMQNK